PGVVAWRVGVVEAATEEDGEKAAGEETPLKRAQAAVAEKRAALLEIELQERRGELVQKVAIRREVRAACETFKAGLNALPGKLAAGVPPEAQFLMLLSLSVMTTWVYLGAKRNILAPTLLHGGQNALVVLNDHLPFVATNWWMAGVFGGVALALVVGTRGRLTSAETNFRIQTSGSAPPVSPGRALDRPDQSRR
ncbi:MAG TPA: hypothetical protein PK530_00620, partial [Anaerolineales bacterium]|nr:hypothetical protein [Anaerolineales bacterium]